MVINEITWRIVPPSLEGAGFFEIRQRAEVEVRSLLLEVKRLKGDVLELESSCEHWQEQALLWARKHKALEPLLQAAKSACPHGEHLLHGANVSIPANAYKALCSAIAETEAVEVRRCCVSDLRREAVETIGLDPKDASAAAKPDALIP